MRNKVDPTVEVAAKMIQSEPWDISHWWVPMVAMAAMVKHECCFRQWSEPYPGTLGDRKGFICGECNQRGPIERVPSLYSGAEVTRQPFALGFCPLDPLCNGKRLKPVSCASAFAGEVNRFCDHLEEVLAPDDRGMILREKAYEAYWAFAYFNKQFPDWDPSGAYDGAFERWEADCALHRFPPWGPEGPPKLVPLTDRIALERREVVTGALRAYQNIIAPAEVALEQALAEADRVRSERMRAVRENPEEEMIGWRREHGEVKVPAVEKFKRRLAALQEESNREYAARHPSFPPTHDDGRKRKAAVDEWEPDAEQLKQAETLLDVSIAIRCDHGKAWARAIGAYENAAARAEEAYARQMAVPPRRTKAANEQADWDTLSQLADRLTKLGTRVEQAIGRFAVFDVTTNRDAIIHQKEEIKQGLGLPKVPVPPRPAKGPRIQHVALAAAVKAEHAAGRAPKAIHWRLKTEMAKRAVKAPSISTIYRWIGPIRRR